MEPYGRGCTVCGKHSFTETKARIANIPSPFLTQLFFQENRRDVEKSDGKNRIHLEETEVQDQQPDNIPKEVSDPVLRNRAVLNQFGSKM